MYRYLENELVEKTNNQIVINAYECNNLTIVVKGNVYWFEHCPFRAVKTVQNEIKKYFPELPRKRHRGCTFSFYGGCFRQIPE